MSDALRLHVEHDGPPDAPGPALLFTHGGADDLHTWDAVRARLAPHVRMILWDLRGHGRSEAPDGAEHYTRDLGLGDLRRVMAAAGITAARPGVLIGHSLGGYLSLLAALTDPAPVAGLVLVATGPGYRSARSRAQWNEGILRIAPKIGLRPDVAHLVVQPDGVVMERLDRLRVPTRVVVGEADRRFHAGCAVIAAAAGTTALMVPGAGHLVHRDDPAAVAGAIIDLHRTLTHG